MKFTESRLEQAIIELLGAQGYPYTPGADIARSEDEVLIEEDLRKYLFEKYQHEKLTGNEVDQVILKLKSYAASDLYESNKAELKADLIVLLAENNYPPVDRDEVYKEIFEQAENFKKYQGQN